LKFEQTIDSIFFQVFEEPTKLFSQSQVPLIAEVLPMLDSIEQSMNLVCDDAESELPNVVCVAAQAVLILINKYYTLMKETELYVIAIGKCGIFYHFLVLTLCSHMS
jgi:hypothetical protein